ncbi:hypothetical protein ABZ419_03150 [Streptomyces cinnamoneus]|uniref:hypothetical protein n=1 Tax=Streptomyces cinnamoneus TaxID=53446 RepID=UPI003402430E
MSLNRENVTWQSQDGTWNNGFYDWVATNADDEDHDPEWDVEYLDAFNWVTAGHPAERAALNAALKEHPNPGSTVIVSWSPERAEEIAHYEQLAADYAARSQHAHLYR